MLKEIQQQNPEIERSTDKPEKGPEISADTLELSKTYSEVERYKPILKEAMAGLLATKSEEEYNNFKKELAKREDFLILYDLLLKLPKEEMQSLENHEKKLAQMEKDELIGKAKETGKFDDFDYRDCIRCKGEFFEVLVGKKDYVIKRLKRGEGDPQKLEKNRKYSLDSHSLNQKYFDKFLPKEETFDHNGQLFVKAEAIHTNDFIDLSTSDEDIRELMKDPNFMNQISEFTKSAKQFNKEAQNYRGEGKLVPDIAGKNLAILKDDSGKFSRLVYIDTMGYLDEVHCKEFNKVKELIDKLETISNEFKSAREKILVSV